MRRRPSRGQPEGPSDPGLQVERTWLAWGRTALSFVAVGALLMHAGRSGAGPVGVVPGLAVVACGVATYVLGRLRHLNLRAAVGAGGSVARPRWLHAVAGCATLCSLLGLTASFVDLG